MSELLSRDKLTNPVDVPVEKVEIPELGGHVFVKGMTAGQRNRFELQFQTKAGGTKGMQLLRQKLLVATVCDHAGGVILKAEDVDALGDQSAVVVERLFNVALRLCGMSNTDADALAGN